MATEQTQNHKCNCNKSIKPLETKITNLEKEVDCLKRQIETLKRVLNSRGV